MPVSSHDTPNALHARIRDNLEYARARMAAAAARAGRGADGVRLVAVTKAAGLAVVEALVALGVTDLGENRVEAAAGKIAAMGARPGPAPCWHMVGHVQRRKAGAVAARFDVVDALDRLKLAESLQRRCEEQDRTIRALLEVNVSGESAKYGFAPETLAREMRALASFDRITVEGLLTMAPKGADVDTLRRIFRGLRELGAEHGLRELSMGMSDDFEIAIEEGATQVRIGRALFA